MKSRITKLIRKILISTVVLLVLFVGAGVGYTWYMGQQAPPISAIETPVEIKKAPVLKPVVRAANAPVGVSVQSIDSPVLPGSNASIIVRTSPGADCTISATYNKIPSKDSGLVNKTADEYGIASWSWTVEESAPLGKWPVKVTCTLGTKSGMVVGDFVVADQID